MPLDLTELTGEIVDDSKRVEFLERLERVLTSMGDPFKMPDLMSEHLREEYQGVDTYYSIPVGYGPLAMQLQMTFKKEMLVLVFLSPTAMRLMEIRLHA